MKECPCSSLPEWLPTDSRFNDSYFGLAKGETRAVKVTREHGRVDPGILQVTSWQDRRRDR